MRSEGRTWPCSNSRTLVIDTLARAASTSCDQPRDARCPHPNVDFGGGAAAAGLAGCGIDLRPLIGNGSGQTGELLRSATPLPPPFTVPLPVPPVRRPVAGSREILRIPCPRGSRAEPRPSCCRCADCG